MENQFDFAAVLREGKVAILDSDSGFGGLSREVHLLEYNGSMFVLRVCDSTAVAKEYEKFSSLFTDFTIMPRLFFRKENQLLYEFLEGRDVTGSDGKEVIEEVGRIYALINQGKKKSKACKEYEQTVLSKLEELTSGSFSFNKKVNFLLQRDKLSKQTVACLNQTQKKLFENLFLHLKEVAQPLYGLDMVDPTITNFRVSDGKIFMVDIGAIKHAPIGFGLAKATIGWFAQNSSLLSAFKKGYEQVNSLDFFTDVYYDFCLYCFSLQALHFKYQVGRNWNVDFERLQQLADKYGIES